MARLLLCGAGSASIAYGFYVTCVMVAEYEGKGPRYRRRSRFILDLPGAIERYWIAIQLGKAELIVGLGLAIMGGLLFYLAYLLDRMRRHLAMQA